METDNPHNCPVCGGCEFMKENGFFYCMECQTQCEGIREQVFELQGDEDNGELLIGTPFVIKKGKKKKKPQNKGDDFTSWELLNFVLIGLTEELVSYGAPESIRDTVLQMWAFYLQKLDIAFFSRDENAIPKLGIKYRTKDAEYVYGNKRKKVRTVRRTSILNSSVNGDLNSTVCNLEDWDVERLQRSVKKKAKRAFMEKIAELSIAEYEEVESTHSSLDQSVTFDTSLDDSLSVSSSKSVPADDESVNSSKMELSETAVAFLSGETEHIKSGTPQIVTRSTLVILLYLALLYEGSTIQLSDLLRWIREGHLSFYEAGKYLPDNCFFQKSYGSLIGLEGIAPTYSRVLLAMNVMTYFLEMNDWILPSASALAKKYVTELQLPELFAELVEPFIALVPNAYYKEVFLEYNLKRNINYEGSILAIIVIILKLLFGLDGRTEHQISKAASQLNMLLEKKNTENTKLFVWKHWVQQLICRRAVLAKFHFPTKHFLCQEVYGNPDAYINHYRNWHEDNAGFQEKYRRFEVHTLQDLHPGLVNTLTSVLEKLQDSTSIKKDDIKFPRSFTPYSIYIQNIIEKSAESETPLVSKEALDVLTQDFTKCDTAYLLQPESIVNLASACGQQLKVKKKRAQKKFKRSTIKNKKKNANALNLPENKVPVYVAATECCSHKSVATRMKEKEEKKNIKMRIRELEVKYDMNKKRMKQQRKLKKKTMRKSKKGPKNGKSDKVKKRTRKKVKRATKSGHSKHSSGLCGTSRKRRKELLSGNSKKIKLSKLLKFYVPSSKYWVLHNENELDAKEFETHILPMFPFSFAWLLSECAFLSEMSKLDLYKEVVRIEKLCHRFVKVKRTVV